jgi:hypothetical protein
MGHCEEFSSPLSSKPSHQQTGLLLPDMRLRKQNVGRHVTGYAELVSSVLKNGVFLDVTQCGSCKNRRFGGT